MKMLASVFDETGRVFMERREVEIGCGEHFCDRCGDCLVCYGGDPCYDGGLHDFVVYADGGEGEDRD